MPLSEFFARPASKVAGWLHDGGLDCTSGRNCLGRMAKVGFYCHVFREGIAKKYSFIGPVGRRTYMA